MLDFITLIDGYKLDHRRQYPDGTQYVYSNFTPRSSRIAGQDSVVNFGLQYALARYFNECASETFFKRSRGDVLKKYVGRVAGYLGPNEIGHHHISALHELGYIPLRFCAWPEGSLVPLRMPLFTVENTLPEFFWVTNYFETLLSNVMWQAVTSATTALRYRVLLDRYAQETGGDPAFVPWQAHDFSFRGMPSPEAAALSGAAHLLSFQGTDCLPSIDLLERYYAAGLGIAGSVPATEHSVMCAGGDCNELETFERLLKLYPTGIVSIVSDTWDLWKVIGTILPALKSQIMAREGKLVIRPDSGVPEDILCGDPKAESGTLPRLGVIPALYELFGGPINAEGFKVLDPHIGTIYGDSITEGRAAHICGRLKAKSFASTNAGLGIGSYTYQYVTRDTYGLAMKATWAQINGEEKFLFKDPKTDDGVKKSARGRIVIVKDENGTFMHDGLTVAAQDAVGSANVLTPVWQDGRFLKYNTLQGIRARLRGEN